MSRNEKKMSTIFYTCKILFGSEGHILAGMSCEECTGTGDGWIRKRTWGDGAGEAPQ